MNGNRFCADTNSLIYFLEGNSKLIPLLNNSELSISIISEIELLSKPSLKKNEIETIKSFIKDCFVYNLNQEIKELSIELRKQYKIKLPDAIVAATALYLEIPLITADSDFKKIDNLFLIIP